jgi:hypothetical protein
MRISWIMVSRNWRVSVLDKSEVSSEEVYDKRVEYREYS